MQNDNIKLKIQFFFRTRTCHPEFTPLESPASWGGDKYNLPPFSKRVVGHKPLAFLRGFTLPELLIVIFIMIILSAIILPNYRGQGSQIALLRSANLLAQHLRTAAEKAMSSQEMGPANFPLIPLGGFGLYFKRDVYSFDNYTIFLFGDCNNDGRYTSGPTICGQAPNQFPEKIMEIKLEKDIVITGLLPETASNELQVLFRPPDPKVFFLPESNEIQISLAHKNNLALTKKIIVKKTGSISLEK